MGNAVLAVVALTLASCSSSQPSVPENPFNYELNTTVDAKFLDSKFGAYGRTATALCTSRWDIVFGLRNPRRRHGIADRLLFSLRNGGRL